MATRFLSMGTRFGPALLACLLLLVGEGWAEQPEVRRDDLFAMLEQTMAVQSNNWISVHAAEALIQLGRPEATLETFRPQAESAEPPYRIGVWRVLARAETLAATREAYVERIRQIIFDASAPDRLHATESLAKLGVPIQSDEERRVVRQLAEESRGAEPFALWRLADGDKPAVLKRLGALLDRSDPVIRLRAAFVLDQLKPWPNNVQDALLARLDIEPADSVARPYMVATVGGGRVRELLAAEAPQARYVGAMALAESSDANVLDWVRPLLNDSDSDVRVAAAYALLKHLDNSPSAEP